MELQEKLRKSEEERIRLEERFNLLEQESRIRHEACINKLRMRYIEFLEEERLRDERNSKLLGALDRVDSSLALMSAKTDKLYSLRKEYEASMLRAYVSRRQTPSVTGDSGIVSHNEDRITRLRKYPQSSPSFPPVSGTSLTNLIHPQRTHTQPASTSSFFPKPLSYPERPTIDYQDRFSSKSRDLEPTWQLSSSRLDASHYPDHADSFRRPPRYLSKESSPFQYPDTIKPLKTSKFTSTLSTPNFEDEKTDNVMENELDKYMSKIRSLHGNLDHSLEEVEHEQNTSGDLLNVTLSDDGLDHLPAEDKTKDMPVEIGKVLAIAEDLASRTIRNTSSTLPEKLSNSLHQDLNLPAINDKNSSTQQPDELKSIAKDLKIDQPQNVELMYQKMSDDTESPAIEINPKASDATAENALRVVEEVVNNDFTTVEELEPWRPEIEAHVEVILINQETDPEESKNDPQTHEVSKNSNINEEDKDKLEMKGDIDAAEVEQQPANLVNDEGDKAQNAVANVTYDENHQNDSQEQVEQYQERNYQDPSVGYDYSNHGDGYQYVDGQYHYNQEYKYDVNGQMIEVTYPQEASEHYQPENYEVNTDYQTENYPEDPNLQYTAENYPQDPNSQYQGENYDPNVQYHEGNYPQEANQCQYEDSNQQYQGDYPADANQGYDYPSNYEYSYGEHQAESNQEYQAEVSGNEQGQVNPEQLETSVGESPVREEENINEESPKMMKNKKKDVIKSLLESESESSIENNTSNTESDFNFN